MYYLLSCKFLQRVINETDPAISENPEQVKVCLCLVGEEWIKMSFCMFGF
jgi:hypothetical protein